MHKRAHLDQLNPPGQIVNNDELDRMSYKPVKTLGDYIDNTLKHEEMMERQANKKKLTFEQWLHHRFPAGVEGHAHMLNLGDLEQCWKAAQENV